MAYMIPMQQEALSMMEKQSLTSKSNFMTSTQPFTASPYPLADRALCADEIPASRISSTIGSPSDNNQDALKRRITKSKQQMEVLKQEFNPRAV